MRSDTEIAIVFKASELADILANYFGYSTKDVEVEDYDEDYIKEIIIDMIL